MASGLATLLVSIFVIILFYIDLKDKPKGISKSLFIPLLWMFVGATRSFSFWVTLKASYVETSDVLIEGNPIDRNFYLVLIILGIIVLYKRRIDLLNIIKSNKLIFIYFLFALVSILWSDFPVVSFKRLIKSFGNIIMVLIILTEEKPEEALGSILRWISFFVIPVSILFIKYYPELGRQFARDGTMMFNGVASQKNILGKSLLIIGIYYFWNFLYSKGKTTVNDRPIKFLILLLIIPLYFYLFILIDSATSLLCLLIGIGILLICKLPVVQKKPVKIITNGIIVVCILLILEFSLGISTRVIEMLGRDSSLTTRVPIWTMLLSMVQNPIIGFGNESFWLGSRILKVWSIYEGILQAHNGYLETYLNLGLIGLILVILQVLSGVFKIKNNLLTNYSFSIFRLAFLIIIIFYNWTEASLYGPNNLWLMFFICIFIIPRDTEKKDLYNTDNSFKI